MNLLNVSSLYFCCSALNKKRGFKKLGLNQKLCNMPLQKMWRVSVPYM